MKNVINTTIDRLAAALAIEGGDDEVICLLKPVVKPVSGKSLAWILEHGGKQWLESIGFAPAVLDVPTFNPKRKYIICVDADDFYSFHRYEDYLSWKY